MKITVKNFQKKIPIYPKRIKKTILKVFSGEKRKTSGEITICFVSDARIRKLNKKFHRTDAPTDVLGFEVSRPGKKKELSADIIISADTAARNSKIYKTSIQYELNLYVVHGLLHFLGFNDNTRAARARMDKKAAGYLSTINH